MTGTAVVILAGGRGSRMGAPKHGVVLADGRTLLDHVRAALEPLGLPVHLSVPVVPPPSLAACGLPLIPDAESHQGPLAAIANALAVLPAAGILVVGCDQPLLDPRLLARLLPPGDDPRPALFLPPDGLGPVPLPGYYPAASRDSLARALAAGERSPRRWARTQECRLLEINATEAATLRSFNTPEELQSLWP